MKKRLISLLVALCMVLTLFPASAFAAPVSRTDVIVYVISGSSGGYIPDLSTSHGNLTYDSNSNTASIGFDEGHSLYTFQNTAATALTCSLEVSDIIEGGYFKGGIQMVQGALEGGVYYGSVAPAETSFHYGYINGGIFLGSVAQGSAGIGGASHEFRINGGIFVQKPPVFSGTSLHTISIANGGKIETLKIDSNADDKISGSQYTVDLYTDTLYVVGTPSSDLTLTLDDGKTYIIAKEDIAANDQTLRPEPKEEPKPTYYTLSVEHGVAKRSSDPLPGSEIHLAEGESVTLQLTDPTQGEMVFSHWDVNNGDTALADTLAKTGFEKNSSETSFRMPAQDLTFVAKYRMPEEQEAEEDSFLMTAAAVTGGAVLTGLIVWQGYNIFSQVYLDSHLPEGTFLPTNRAQLALLLWNTAGCPTPGDAGRLFPDISDPDTQTAAQWAVEQGLLKARRNGTFAPEDSVSAGQVYRTWQRAQKNG